MSLLPQWRIKSCPSCCFFFFFLHAQLQTIVSYPRRSPLQRIILGFFFLCKSLGKHLAPTINTPCLHRYPLFCMLIELALSPLAFWAYFLVKWGLSCGTRGLRRCTALLATATGDIMPAETRTQHGTSRRTVESMLMSNGYYCLWQILRKLMHHNLAYPYQYVEWARTVCLAGNTGTPYSVPEGCQLLN